MGEAKHWAGGASLAPALDSVSHTIHQRGPDAPGLGKFKMQTFLMSFGGGRGQWHRGHLGSSRGALLQSSWAQPPPARCQPACGLLWHGSGGRSANP